MKQFLCVLRFEMGNYFQNKSFVVVTLLLAVLAAGVVAVPGIIQGVGGSGTQQQAAADEPAADEPAILAVYDANQSIADTAELEQLMPEYQMVWCSGEEAVKEQVAGNEAAAGFIIRNMQEYVYVIENRSFSDEQQYDFEAAMGLLYRSSYLAEKGLAVQEFEDLYQMTIESETEVLGKDSVNNFAYTYMLIFVLYFLIIFYGQMIAVAVTTEKSNRAIEILVTSVNSTSLIFGKVIAGAISGVAQTLLILGSAFVSYSFCREAWNHQLDFLFQIPGSVWAVFIFFGLLGYLFYTFIYGMLGALVSKTEDISKSSTPVMLIYIASFMVAIFSLQNSDSMLVKVCSFIPFTSSNGMLVRVAMGSVQMWEIILSGVILAASCVLAGVLAAKIFRFGTLMYGNPIKFTNALKNIRQQDN